MTTGFAHIFVSENEGATWITWMILDPGSGVRILTG